MHDVCFATQWHSSDIHSSYHVYLPFLVLCEINELMTDEKYLISARISS